MIADGILLEARAPFELRLIDLNSVSPISPAPASLEEQARAKRFRFAHHQHRYLVGRAALRRVLSGWSGIPPTRLCFGEAGNGKPVLLDRPGIHFSISYSHEAILIGVGTQGPLGVDIEYQRLFPEARTLARDCFNTAECRTLRKAGAGMAESTMFLRGWTRKEACLKAAELGLSQDPARVATGLEATRQKVAVADAVRAEVGSFEVGKYIASWARII